MKRSILIILSMSMLICSFSIRTFGADNVYSWYCKRVANNVQPPIPSEFSFITEYDGIWINNSRRNEDSNKIAYLTFDAGYENGNVEKILDVLKEKQVPGAFFILINLINSNPDLVKRMANEGHTVCNHTAYHKDMSKITNINDFESELNTLSNAYSELTGQSMAKFYRPPEGKFSKLNLQHAQQSGYKTVFWSLAYADWDNNKQPSHEYAKKKIMDNIHNGAVILLHPTSSTNAEILGDIIDEMRNKGYEFGTLDDLYKEISAD